MKKTSKKIIFFGTDDFSATSLTRLIDDGYSIVVVVTKPDSKRGRGKKLSEPAVKKIARQHNISVLQPTNVLSLKSDIEKIPNRLGVLVSYGKIIPQDILNLFEPTGIINLHPSRLPKYRGPSPIETAISNGDSSIGISFIKLTDQMDAGPIYHQTSVDIDTSQGFSEVSDTLSSVGSSELSEVINKVIQGNIKSSPQDESKATYTQLLSKNHGVIDCSKTGKEIMQSIKAFEAWPKSRINIGGLDLIVKEAHFVSGAKKLPGNISTDSKSYISISIADGELYIDRLQPAGKNPMTVKAFLAGYGAKITDLQR